MAGNTTESTPITFVRAIADIPVVILSLLSIIGLGIFVFESPFLGELTTRYFSVAFTRLSSAPAPDTIFAPYTGIWGEIYTLYLTQIVPLTLVTLLFAIFISLYDSRMSARESIRYLLKAIIASAISLLWWWVAIAGFQFVNYVSNTLAPAYNIVSPIGHSNPPTTLIGVFADVMMFLVVSIYYFRDALYYIVLLAMPVLIGLSLIEQPYLTFVSRPAEMLVEVIPPLLILPISTSALLLIADRLFFSLASDPSAMGGVWWLGIVVVLFFATVLPTIVFTSYFRLKH